MLMPPLMFKHMKSRTTRARVERTPFGVRAMARDPRADILEPSPFYGSQQKIHRVHAGKTASNSPINNFFQSNVSDPTNVTQSAASGTLVMKKNGTYSMQLLHLLLH